MTDEFPTQFLTFLSLTYVLSLSLYLSLSLAGAREIALSPWNLSSNENPCRIAAAWTTRSRIVLPGSLLKLRRRSRAPAAHFSTIIIDAQTTHRQCCPTTVASPSLSPREPPAEVVYTTPPLFHHLLSPLCCCTNSAAPLVFNIFLLYFIVIFNW